MLVTLAMPECILHSKSLRTLDVCSVTFVKKMDSSWVEYKLHDWQRDSVFSVSIFPGEVIPRVWILADSRTVVPADMGDDEDPNGRQVVTSVGRSTTTSQFHACGPNSPSVYWPAHPQRLPISASLSLVLPTTSFFSPGIIYNTSVIRPLTPRQCRVQRLRPSYSLGGRWPMTDGFTGKCRGAGSEVSGRGEQLAVAERRRTTQLQHF